MPTFCICILVPKVTVQFTKPRKGSSLHSLQFNCKCRGWDPGTCSHSWGMTGDSLSPAAGYDIARKPCSVPRCSSRVDPVGVDTPQQASVTRSPHPLGADRSPCEVLSLSSAGINCVTRPWPCFRLPLRSRQRHRLFLEAQDGYPKPMG